MAKILSGLLGFCLLAGEQDGFRMIGVAKSKELNLTIDVFANDAFSKRVTLTDFKLVGEKGKTTADFIAVYIVCTAVLKSKDDLGLRYAPYNAKGLSLGGPRLFSGTLKPGEKTEIKLSIDRDAAKDMKSVKFFVE